MTWVLITFSGASAVRLLNQHINDYPTPKSKIIYFSEYHTMYFLTRSTPGEMETYQLRENSVKIPVIFASETLKFVVKILIENTKRK